MTQFAPIWNSSGVDFTALRVSATDIASSGTSKLIDLRVNNSGVFSVDKTGSITYGNGLSLNSVLSGYLPLSGGTLTGGLSGTTGVFSSTLSSSILTVSGGQLRGTNAIEFRFNDTTAPMCVDFRNRAIIGNNHALAFTSNSNASADSPADFLIQRDGARALSFYSASVPGASTGAATVYLYGTKTDASNYRRLYLSSTTAGAFTLGVEGLGTGASGNTLSFNVGGSERMKIDTNGNVGIGSSSANVGLVIRRSGADLPALRLEDGDVTVPFTSLSINPSLNANTIGDWSAAASASGGCAFNGFTNNTAVAYPLVFTGYQGSTSPVNPAVMFAAFKSNGGSDATTLSSAELIAGFYNGSVAGSAVVTISASGAISAASAAFSGHLSAATKSFLIKHPTKEGRKLQYGSLESPYHGIRLTGRDQLINGVCVVELPDYVSALVHDDINIQLTPIGRNVLWVEEHDLESNTFTVKGDQNGKFYWSFTAVRKDIEPLEVEPWE